MKCTPVKNTMQYPLPDHVKDSESSWIRNRRKKAHVPESSPTVGLAFSGGGIKSSTFNLGLLQALRRSGIFRYIDYLSTVSGGGYIGSCLSWFMSLFPETTEYEKRFPFGTTRSDNNTFGGSVLKHLRAHGRFLVEEKAPGIWVMIAAAIQAILINLLILTPPMLIIIKLLGEELPSGFAISGFVSTLFSIQATGYGLLLFIGLLLTALFMIIAISIPIVSQFNLQWIRKVVPFLQKKYSYLLIAACVLFAIGLIPLFHDLIGNLKYIASIPLSGIASVAGSLIKRDKTVDLSPLRSALLTAGLALLVYGMLILFYHITAEHGPIALPYSYLIIGSIASIILSLFSNINHLTLLRFYRERLINAFLPITLAKELNPSATAPDQFRLTSMSDSSGAPYHLINTALLTRDSDDITLRNRLCDSFIFSPLFCGSGSTCYIKTDEYVHGRMNLATAFAISGAALESNTPLTKSRPLSFLMAFFNFHLGYWIVNPRYWHKHSFLHPFALKYMFMEMFGIGLSEKKRSVHLCDAGFFDNLGLYELIRRRCDYMIVSDVSDGYTYESLNKVIDMVRSDFGAEIDLPMQHLLPDNDNYLPLPFAIGKVFYPDNTESHLLYIKTSMLKDLPADIVCYRIPNKKFPHESIADQFYDEIQFEAYRELGYQIGRRVFGDNRSSMEELFEMLKKITERGNQ